MDFNEQKYFSNLGVMSEKERAQDLVSSEGRYKLGKSKDFWPSAKKDTSKKQVEKVIGAALKNKVGEPETSPEVPFNKLSGKSVAFNDVPYKMEKPPSGEINSEALRRLEEENEQLKEYIAQIEAYIGDKLSESEESTLRALLDYFQFSESNPLVQEFKRRREQPLKNEKKFDYSELIEGIKPSNLPTGFYSTEILTDKEHLLLSQLKREGLTEAAATKIIIKNRHNNKPSDFSEMGSFSNYEIGGK